MTTGTKNALLLPLVKVKTIKHISLVLLFCAAFSQQANEMPSYTKGFLNHNRIFHQPEKVLFNSRAFNLEMFVEIDKNLIKEASLFFRTDSQPRYREISFSLDKERFIYRYNPKENPAKYITYFFTVELKSGQIYATPVDSSGLLIPITKDLVDPIKYYKERAEGKS